MYNKRKKAFYAKIKSAGACPCCLKGIKIYMLEKRYEKLIEATRSYLLEKYGAAFLKLNEKQKNIMICETVRKFLNSKKAPN